MVTEADCKKLALLVSWLEADFAKPANSRVPPERRTQSIATFDRLQKTWGRLESGQVNEWLYTKVPFKGFPAGKVLVLPAVEVDSYIMVPVLRLVVDDLREHKVLRAYFAVYLAKSPGHKWLGLRFESPEGGPQERGSHNFHHMQFCSEMEAFEGITPIGLPTSSVALPLGANDCVQLLLCALATFYGISVLDQLRRHSKPEIRALWETVKAMPLFGTSEGEFSALAQA